jgi:REP element-mobilizing transposase RayT
VVLKSGGRSTKMKNIICSNCGKFMGKSSREINEKYKEARWNEAMRIRLWCLDCCRKNTIESLKDTSLEKGERDG